MKQNSTTMPRHGAAFRAQKRNQQDAERIVNQYASAGAQADTDKIKPQESHKLKLTFLGGLDDVGEKNMAILEWQNDALVIDCGNNLGIDLPGVNYEINDPAYLLGIKHKVRGYVITHGHLDHIGGLKHVVPFVPAPIYGSRFTLGIVGKTFEDAATETGLEYKPELVPMGMDNHERLKVGAFFIELIRVTHSLPEPAAICIDTPVGRIIVTGDFRLDPEPLDYLPTDIKRLEELGNQGVLLLLSESSYADCEGRTPTEQSLQQSFYDVIANADGRIFVSVFSSNINRIQMIINAAVTAGRKIALDGRSMLAYAEIAVTQGILRVPKGSIISMKQCANIPDKQLLVMCTGGQGEPKAALQRMSEGEHKYMKLRAGDTVVISSSPIPGNEIRYDQISNKLSKLGVALYRHPTHKLDGCGPLHVSGHARREELREMLRITKPAFFIPVHGGALRRTYHAKLAIMEGHSKDSILLPDNGDSLTIDATTIQRHGHVPHGSLLVDQNGTITSGVVIKDRLLLAEEGILNVILTVDGKAGQLLTSPDIVSRGFIHLRDNENLMHELRAELRRATHQRFQRLDIDRFKTELREHVMHFLFEKTGQSPLVIPVVNVIPDKKTTRAARQPGSVEKSALHEQRRFQEMRSRLLG